ncbi:hypothetical protein ACFXKC_28415 [Streptomyces sp. NPDC059340]|uniref:zinc finger domain-containing protein n=1 Tax=Streptomyces sp. NPDC059340 TaxID=3346806 RepID=UPI00369F8498
MNRQEVVLLARYVRAVCPQQKIDEYTADAWHDFLGPYSLNEARAAVHRHVTLGNAFISIGEICAQIRRARNDRLARHTEAEPPYGDFGDASYKAALHDERRAIADGRTEPVVVPALPPGEKVAEYEGRGRALLNSVGRESISRRPELAAPCPHCDAAAGRPCTNGRGDRRVDAHPSRIEASHDINAGKAPAGREDIEREIERRRQAAAAVAARLTEPPEPDDDFDPVHRTKAAAKKAGVDEETAAS